MQWFSWIRYITIQIFSTRTSIMNISPIHLSFYPYKFSGIQYYVVFNLKIQIFLRKSSAVRGPYSPRSSEMMCWGSRISYFYCSRAHLKNCPVTMSTSVCHSHTFTCLVTISTQGQGGSRPGYLYRMYLMSVGNFLFSPRQGRTSIQSNFANFVSI